MSNAKENKNSVYKNQHTESFLPYTSNKKVYLEMKKNVNFPIALERQILVLNVWTLMLSQC